MFEPHALLANVRHELCDLLCVSGASAAWVPESLRAPGVQIGFPHFRAQRRLTFSLETVTLHVWAPDEKSAFAVRQLAPALVGRINGLMSGSSRRSPPPDPVG